MRQLRNSGNFTEQLPAGSSSSSNITNNNNDNCGVGYASSEVTSNNMASNVNIFGGMEVLRTRQKRRGTSNIGSRTPHADSLISQPPKDQLSPLESSTKKKPFFMRYDMQVDSLQDDVEDPQVTRMRERLERFYNEYSPSMLSAVESTIKSFFGREEELFKLLVAKYGPEPMMLQPSVLPKSDFLNQTTQSEAGSAFDFIQSGTKYTYGEDVRTNNGDILVNTGSSHGFSLPQTFVKEPTNHREVSAPGAISGFSFPEPNSKGGSVFEFVAVKADLNEPALENVAPPVATGTSLLPRQSEDKIEEEEREEQEEDISLPLQRYTESSGLKANSNNNNNNNDNKSRIEDNISNSSKNRRIKSSSNSSNSSNSKNKEENLWDRQKREINEFQRNVLISRAKLANVLNQIRNSILERRDVMSKVRKVEEAIEKCVGQEDFEQANILSDELEEITSRVVELDAEPTQLLVLFAHCKEELNSAVRHLAHLLLQHREELIACKDDEEKRVKKFISDMTFSLENRSDKVAAELERAQRTKSNALQEAENLRERKLKIGEKMQHQSKEIRAQQEQLTCDVAELNAEIVALEAKLTQLRQTRAEKAAALKEISSNAQRLTEECGALEGEVDTLLKEEESRANTAAADVVDLQERSESLEREKSEFEAKKEFLLSELQGGVAKIDSYNARRVSLETDTIDTLQRCSNALEIMLRTRAAGCGVLYRAVPSLRSAATCTAEEYPLAQVHHLQKQLRALSADDERNAALVTSLSVQITEMRNGIPLLEDAKKSAVQAKRFKEAQLKAEELRALTVSIEEVTAKKESTQEMLRANASKRTTLQKELDYERVKASKSVKVFLNRYHNVLSMAMEATAAPPNVLQIAVDEDGSDELAEAMQQLVGTLQEEWFSVPNMNDEDKDGDVANFADSNSNNGDVSSTYNGASNDTRGTTFNADILPIDSTTVVATREEMEEKLLALQKRQNEALEIEDYETCDRIQEEIEALEKQLDLQVSVS
ncbi:hypothetical protein LSM04_000506 [Trypanosoma melophagium]|uniref:uncharacterized protein n=1 Tax=Trypanosoma melophagium TaxID=715481 RepID=UPI003519F141|nr:hypothetical protein LSM04_000506 [Trypanosoma melophagium]